MDSSTFNLVKELKQYIKEEAKELINTLKTDAYSSLETKDLNLALSKAQGAYPKINYNRIDPYFQKEYADLDAILKPILPILADNELALAQWSELDSTSSDSSNSKVILHTQLLHSTGQWKESRARVIPPKIDPLSFTSTKNQIKRDEAMSLLGITISNDVLDDNAAIQLADSRQIIAKGSQSPLLYNPRERSTECISRDQLDMLEKELVTCPDYVEEIFKGANIQSLADLPRNKFDYTVDKIRKVNLVRAGKRPNAD